MSHARAVVPSAGASHCCFTRPPRVGVSSGPLRTTSPPGEPGRPHGGAAGFQESKAEPSREGQAWNWGIQSPQGHPDSAGSSCCCRPWRPVPVPAASELLSCACLESHCRERGPPALSFFHSQMNFLQGRPGPCAQPGCWSSGGHPSSDTEVCALIKENT